MPFTQETFFGASIRNFRASVGWGQEVSTCTIGLVEDTNAGDSFSTPVAVGQPASFIYQDWSFRGILQSWRKSNSEGGYPLYEVTLKDPREILQGVQLIIAGYTGVVYSVPNVYNIYGYLENTLGFGQSKLNDSGIPWMLIRNAFNVLQSTNPISFRSYNYTVDLSLLPLISEYYRIGGNDSVSLMDFIDEICSAGGRDYYFKLVGSIIKLYTISRNTIPSPGRIQQFIDSLTEGANQSEVGEELRHEFTSKFLVGGQVEQVYLQEATDDSGDDPNTASEHYDNAIWPYWGLDTQGNAIIGKGIFVPDDETEAKDIHEFSINIAGLNLHEEFPTHEYKTDIMEMQAVLGGIDTWETFLFFNDNVTGVSATDNPHHGKATRLGLTSFMKYLNKFVKEGASDADVKFLPPYVMAAGDKPMIENLENFYSAQTNKIQALYDFVKNFADEYYGRKFMVRVPFVSGALESETDNIMVSQEPTDSGYVEDAVLDSAIGGGLIAADLDMFKDQHGKIVAYVKYNGRYDVSELDVGDFYYDIGTQNLFIKCEVEKELVYLDKATFYGPRAVITLPAKIRTFPTDATANSQIELLRRFLTIEKPTIATAAIQKQFSMFGSDALMFKMDQLCQIPRLAAVPLKSNILTYGPWYSIGVSGKTDFEKDSTLVPWNYGGFEYMNLVGNAKVAETISNQQFEESGSITFAGVPTADIGGLLLDGGPYVTDVYVDIDEQGGAKTTYRMQTWTSKFGKTPRQLIERMQRIHLLLQKQRREFREQMKILFPGKRTRGKFKAISPRFDGRKSTHPVICADILTHDTTDERRANVLMAPMHNIDAHLKQDYDKKALGSLDTIFRPFATSSSDSNFPHFETPTDSSVPCVTNLNPFTTPHDMSLLISGTGVPDNGIVVQDNGEGVTDYRAIGLRMPMIGVGWGYDTGGKPVPNATPESPGDSYADDYRTRMDLWKAGPIDIRWDDDRKVWVASSTAIKMGTLATSLSYRSSCTFTVKNWAGETLETVTAYDWLLPSGTQISAGVNGVISFIGDRYILIAAEPPCVV